MQPRRLYSTNNFILSDGADDGSERISPSETTTITLSSEQITSDMLPVRLRPQANIKSLVVK